MDKKTSQKEIRDSGRTLRDDYRERRREKKERKKPNPGISFSPSLSLLTRGNFLFSSFYCSGCCPSYFSYYPRDFLRSHDSAQPRKEKRHISAALRFIKDNPGSSRSVKRFGTSVTSVARRRPGENHQGLVFLFL